jgi:6-phosphogluconolactonase
MSERGEIVALTTPQAVAREAARRLVHLSNTAVKSRGRFSVALSGGSTPRKLYQLLAEKPYQSQVPWKACHLFWGDERCVPPGDPDSNYRLAREALIQQVPVPTHHVHRIPVERGPISAAEAYARTLIDFFCGTQARFDLVLLGMGQDGHVASLFPGSAALEERERLAVAVEADYQDTPADRVTLTLPAINAARQILFLVTGSAKAGIVRAVMEQPGAGLPAQAVRPSAGELVWLLDAGAASLLGR